MRSASAPAGGGSGTGNPGGAGGNGICVVTYAPNVITLSNNVTVTGSTTIMGTVSKGSGTFVIDDPLDPINKLLYHSFVESPDVMNIYDGIATLNNIGEAIISLPPYFLALNKDFRYFANSDAQPMPNLHLAEGVHKRFFGLFGPPVFTISGGVPFGKVSWQVTGIRHDPLILDHPIIPVIDKGGGQPFKVGEYQCPECYH